MISEQTPRIYDTWNICDMINAMAEMRFYSSKESEHLPTQDESTTTDD